MEQGHKVASVPLVSDFSQLHDGTRQNTLAHNPYEWRRCFLVYDCMMADGMIRSDRLTKKA